MEIRVLEKNSDRTMVSFLLKGIPPSYANTLRRIMINKVPTMAIEDVEIKKNSSAMYDETLAHRLGLIALTTDLSSYNLKGECKCEGKGCAQCELKITLKAKGPGVVYASAMKSQDPKVVPVHAQTPIVKLLKGQEIELTAVATLGLGKDHAKWAPGLVFYKNKPAIDIDNKKCDNCEDCIKSCPVDVYEMKNKKIAINQDNFLKCHMCLACVDACPKGAIKVTPEENSYIFTIESWGQLDAKDIAKAAIGHFNNTLDTLGNKLKEIK